VKYAMQALQLVLSDDDESCYEIQLALKWIITLNVQVQYICYMSGIMSNFNV
jgi:hypothetical protein